MMSEVKAVCCTTVEIPISLTPKKIEFKMIKDSAAELVIANKVAFIESEESFQKVKFKLTYNSFLLDNID